MDPLLLLQQCFFFRDPRLNADPHHAINLNEDPASAPDIGLLKEDKEPATAPDKCFLNEDTYTRLRIKISPSD
jgi:hypothetical protein